MGYDVNNDPYLDLINNVLINNFGVKDASILEEIETTITSAVLANLTVPSDFSFSTATFLELHKDLFGDIYAWAGKPREIDISKGNSYFAHVPHITQSLDGMLQEMSSDSRLKSDSSEAFISALAHYYSELNAIHPFREGNGRTARAFLSLTAMYYGWDLDWTTLDKEENLRASIASIAGDERPFIRLLTPLVSRADSSLSSSV